MATSLESPTKAQTLAELLAQLGNIPAERIRVRPAPGTATEQDVIEVADHEDRLCELVDGVLVEKGMGIRESIIAGVLLGLFRQFVVPRNLGLVTGQSGTMRIFPGLVRIPDVAYISWARVPGGRIPEQPIPDLVPDLVVEVLSVSNTAQEMIRKRREYFQAGVRLAWFIDPVARTIDVYPSPDAFQTLSVTDLLKGDPILPGFQVPVRELFAELDRTA